MDPLLRIARRIGVCPGWLQNGLPFDLVILFFIDLDKRPLKHSLSLRITHFGLRCGGEIALDRRRFLSGETHHHVDADGDETDKSDERYQLIPGVHSKHLLSHGVA